MIIYMFTAKTMISVTFGTISKVQIGIIYISFAANSTFMTIGLVCEIAFCLFRCLSLQSAVDSPTMLPLRLRQNLDRRQSSKPIHRNSSKKRKRSLPASRRTVPSYMGWWIVFMPNPKQHVNESHALKRKEKRQSVRSWDCRMLLGVPGCHTSRRQR